MAQLVEHILGKDEVPGSNPGISLKRRRSIFGLDGIFISMDKFHPKLLQKHMVVCYNKVL